MHGRTLLYCVSSAATTTSGRVLALVILAAAAWSMALARTQPTPSIFPLIVHWTVKFDRAPVANAPPVSDADRIYIALRSGLIVARAVRDGADVWQRPLVTDRPITLDNGLLFVVGGNAIEALRARDGSTVWTRPIPSPSAPLLAKGGWIIIVSDTNVIALRAKDGSIVWTRQVGTVYHRPAIESDRLYVPADDGRIVALDLEKGDPLWTRELPGAPGEPVATSDHVYVGSSDRLFYALKAGDGDVDWTWRIGANVLGAPAVDDKRVYFVALDNVIRALDRESGVQRWQHAIRRRAASGPALVEDVVLLASSSSGEIYAWLTNGRPAGTLIVDSPPVVAPDLAGGYDTGARVSVVTGSLADVWQLSMIAAASEPPPGPLTVLPGTPLQLPALALSK
jgi:outer membrane protein assembly factor BamB